MRKITYSVSCSLDGYISPVDEATDWLVMTEDAGEILRDLWADVDAILMGRKTYEFVARHGGSAGSPSIETYIFSTTMAAAPKGSTLVKEDAVGFVARLKAAEGGKIFLFGGGELASILIDAGLVDEIECGIQPVLLGGGTPMFRPMTRRIALARLEARELAGDGVFVRYRLQSPPKGPPQTAHVSTDLAPA